MPVAPVAISAPTMMTEDTALVTLISGECSAGVTPHHVVADEAGQREDRQAGDEEVGPAGAASRLRCEIGGFGGETVRLGGQRPQGRLQVGDLLGQFLACHWLCSPQLLAATGSAAAKFGCTRAPSRVSAVP